ncbi:hypothetical protein DFR74_103118 [Nocardia puris]|uniref:Uncharacterized protein n=1 Tax=Nocardia puris TaxID=208602 RepID=A0A366DRF5_9NOCA|nr:hypothetical protein DFR74_103118 [Nocardia puris]
MVKEVVDDLTSGKSVVIVFPDVLVESSVADSMLHDVALEGARSEYCHSSAEPFHSRVLTTFGADPAKEREFDEWDTIIEWEPWHGSWLVVPSWDHPDVAEIVRRWPAQLTACGLPVEHRPKMIIGVRLADLPRRIIAHLDRSAISVRWWWGVLDRLDTESLLVGLSECRLRPLDHAVITELSGWDLRFTRYLLDNWDRTTPGLAHTVHRYRETITNLPSSDPSSSGDAPRRRLTAPPADLEESWRDGLVDWWGQSLRWAPAVLDTTAISQRLWLAHSRVLMPHVDEERAHFERKIRIKATERALSGLFRRDDDIIEIGSLAWLVEYRGIDIGVHERGRLQAFRDLRNVLAHRNPVPDELLRRIADYLDL